MTQFGWARALVVCGVLLLAVGAGMALAGASTYGAAGELAAQAGSAGPGGAGDAGGDPGGGGGVTATGVQLPFTGAEAWPIVATGVALLLAGVALRRRST